MSHKKIDTPLGEILGVCPLYLFGYFVFLVFSCLDDAGQIPAHQIQHDHGNRQKEIPVVVRQDIVEDVKHRIVIFGGIDREHIVDPDDLSVKIKELGVVDREIDKMDNGVRA